MMPDFRGPANTFRCQAEHCNEPIDRRYIMCPPHFLLVPRELKGRIYQAYREGVRGGAHPSKAYRDFVTESILYVAEWERVHPPAPVAVAPQSAKADGPHDELF